MLLGQKRKTKVCGKRKSRGLPGQKRKARVCSKRKSRGWIRHMKPRQCVILIEKPNDRERHGTFDSFWIKACAPEGVPPGWRHSFRDSHRGNSGWFGEDFTLTIWGSFHDSSAENSRQTFHCGRIQAMLLHETHLIQNKASHGISNFYSNPKG